MRSSIPVQWTGVYAALREFCNFEVRKTRRLAFNPVYAVELGPEVTPEARRWSASEARDAAVDPEIRRRTLGHADVAMTAHYRHIEAEAHKTAAEAVAKLVETASS